ncbi:MAG: sugar ABC transporter substrate-binding protein [Firmicutes bacterium HGW-Firmicutes-1]|jgi:multiple sugar transport system substrate-binding protein|nr:MAG: sugar ABC transporter substrate-binding protein [Firmicutes bacterium HGW-Firmicutes-1]
MNRKSKTILIKALVICTLMSIVFFVYQKNRTIHIEFGLFAGSNWNVPISECYKIYDEAIREFEKEYPNIKVTYRSGALREDYSEWVAQKILNGNEPDVFIVPEEDFNTFSSIGMLEDLNAYIEKDHEFELDAFYDKALEAGMYDDKRYSVPMEIVPSLMCVNVTLLNKEGIVLPENDWTWGEFYKICKDVTKDTDGDHIIDQFGVYGYQWDQAFYSNGQVLFDEKGKTLQFMDAAMVETIDLVKNLNQLNLGVKVTAKDFDTGKVAFRPFTLAEYRAYRDYPYSIKKYSAFQWKYVSFPKGPGGENIAESTPLLIGMSSRTKEGKAAWEFIKYLTYNVETQLNVWDYTNGMPANKRAVEKIFERQKTGVAGVLDYEMLSNLIEDSVISLRFKKYNQIKEVIDQIIYLGIIEEKNAGQLVRDIKREVNKQLLE